MQTDRNPLTISDRCTGIGNQVFCVKNSLPPLTCLACIRLSHAKLTPPFAASSFVSLLVFDVVALVSRCCKPVLLSHHAVQSADDIWLIYVRTPGLRFSIVTAGALILSSRGAFHLEQTVYWHRYGNLCLLITWWHQFAFLYSREKLHLCDTKPASACTQVTILQY